MKWISLWIKKMQMMSTQNCLQSDTTTVICTKAINIRKSRKKPDFEMPMPSCGMCCTIMVHFLGVPIKNHVPLH